MGKRNRRLISGAHLVVQIKGPNLEQFLNQCIEEGICLWNTYKYPSGILIVYMNSKDFFQLRKICFGTGRQIKIIERKGVLFLLNRFVNRKAFAMGSLVALLAWYFLSSFIWFVSIDGIEQVDKQKILTVAAQSGLAPGRLKSDVDREEVKRNLLITIDDLIWAGIEIRGTHAIISVAERSVTDAASFGPGHIIASRDGVVDSIMVLKGTPLVQEKDTVLKGQILISGLIEPDSAEFIEKINKDELPYIRAQGVVTATVWYETSADVKVGAGISAEEAQDLAKKVAWSQMENILAGKNMVGQPVIEWIEIKEEGVWRVRILVQTIEEIGMFFPVHS